MLRHLDTPYVKINNTFETYILKIDGTERVKKKIGTEYTKLKYNHYWESK